MNRNLLTDARYDVELVVDLLVHGGGDDADFREGVGHRVDAHLRHEQGQQEDLVLGDIVVLHRTERRDDKLVSSTADWRQLMVKCKV